MALPRTARLGLVAYALVAAATLVASLAGSHLVSAVLFACAMPTLAVVLVTGRPGRDRLQQTTLVAVLLSWLGDWVPEIVGNAFVLKAGLFALAHVAFIVAFLPSWRRTAAYRWPVLLAYVVVIGGALVWLVPRAGGLGPVLVGYGLLLGGMAVLATGISWPAGLGGALFVVSDLTIAVSYVLRMRHPAVEVVIVVTYLAAQLLLVLGVLRTPRPADQVSPDRPSSRPMR